MNFWPLQLTLFIYQSWCINFPVCNIHFRNMAIMLLTLSCKENIVWLGHIVMFCSLHSRWCHLGKTKKTTHGITVKFFNDIVYFMVLLDKLIEVAQQYSTQIRQELRTNIYCSSAMQSNLLYQTTCFERPPALKDHGK